MHHGFYDPGVPVSLSDHQFAQIRMVEAVLAFAGVQDDDEKKPKRIVDVGSGLGGSSRYLARKYGANCYGITLSPLEVQKAQALSASEGLAHKVFFQVADAMDQPFPDGHFNLVWCMESVVYMPDKMKFFRELARVAAPGATIIIVTWCHRELSPSDSLRPEEKDMLKRISDAAYLQGWSSANDFVKLAQSLSLEDIKCADWSANAAPTWPAVIQSYLTFKGFIALLRSGWKAIKGALVMPLIVEGYDKGLIKFVVVSCRKPK
ncbi:hypothetical protein QJS10_CPB11g00044 [Acorus calamus]|uniref:Methyltransferase type 11 domain-containing protein n=1 Tax=Acorus calamus TaxID=4465 RepID=A0AAV9DUS2_ACOCL|nr:hypothetical protein QJS10_CPB11g00044 [Acorus calamus]